jgi:non-ribosomal peptide synthetase component F
MPERAKAERRPADKCVHELVEAIAKAHPGLVAVQCGDQVLTYRELSERTSRLAHHLSGLGFRQPSVGILLPRSAEFVIAALAVLKLGGSYTPLDAEYPLPRLKTMLAAARCPIVITATPLLGRLGSQTLPDECDLVPVCLDTLDETLAALPADGPAVPVHPDLLAYTMFTSGSTGVPKGVMITHRGVARLVGPPGIVDLTCDDVLLHVSSVSFDAATFDIWSALTAGAKLIVAPAGRTSAVEIGRLISEHKVTTVLLPTGLFHLMVDERVADLRGLRQVVAGGDVLSSEHARRFTAAVPGRRHDPYRRR